PGGNAKRGLEGLGWNGSQWASMVKAGIVMSDLPWARRKVSGQKRPAGLCGLDAGGLRHRLAGRNPPRGRRSPALSSCRSLEASPKSAIGAIVLRAKPGPRRFPFQLKAAILEIAI